MTAHAVWGVVALAGVAVAVASLVYLHVQRTGVSPLRDSVSAYGISPLSLWYRVAVIATGIAGAAEAIGLGGDLKRVRLAVLCLWVFAVARVLIAWFPMDRQGEEQTRRGRVHGVLAIVAFAAVTVAALQLRATLARGARWHHAAATLNVLAWCLLLTALAMLVVRGTSQLAKWFGLSERAFYVAMMAWLGAVGVALIAS
jgi:Ca2+/Na+ antiporter